MTKQEQLKFHELQAQWWIAYATTGACKERNMRTMDGVQMSDECKVNDSLEIAQTHIRLFMEVSENW